MLAKHNRSHHLMVLFHNIQPQKIRKKIQIQLITEYIQPFAVLSSLTMPQLHPGTTKQSRPDLIPVWRTGQKSRALLEKSTCSPHVNMFAVCASYCNCYKDKQPFKLSNLLEHFPFTDILGNWYLCPWIPTKWICLHVYSQAFLLTRSSVIKGAVNTCNAPSPGVMDTFCLIYPAPVKGHRWGNTGKLIVMLPVL